MIADTFPSGAFYLGGGPRVDVRAFGARGNYTTDDTEAVQKALDYAAYMVIKRYEALIAACPSLGEAAWSEGSAGFAVYFPEGRYRVAKTLVKFPGVSLIGDGPGSTITFEPVLGTYTITGGTGIDQLTADPAWCDTTGLYVVLYVPPQVQVTVAGAARWFYTYRDHISDLCFECRKNTVGILVKGITGNLRLRRLHLHGYGADQTVTSIGVAIVDRFPNEPRSTMAVNPPGQSEITGTLRSAQGAWNTDGEVSSCFIEGFKVGIYGVMGEDGCITNCGIVNCVRGIKTFNNKLLTISNNRVYCPGTETGYSQDTGIMVQGEAMSITNNVVRNFRAGLLLSGRGLEAGNNVIALAADANVNSAFDGHAIRCVPYNWQASGASYGDAGLPNKQYLGGTDPGQDGLSGVHSTVIEYLSTFPSGKAPVCFQGYTLSSVSQYSGGQTYSRGDRVWSGDPRVYYEYISYTPTQGNAPPNADYWRLIPDDRTLLFSCHGISTHAVGADPTALIKWSGANNRLSSPMAQPYFLMDENPLVRMPVTSVATSTSDQTVSSDLSERQLQNFVQFNFGYGQYENRKLYLPDPANQAGRKLIISCYKNSAGYSTKITLDVTGSPSNKLFDIASQAIASTIDLFSAVTGEKLVVFETWCDGTRWYVRK